MTPTSTGRAKTHYPPSIRLRNWAKCRAFADHVRPKWVKRGEVPTCKSCVRLGSAS